MALVAAREGRDGLIVPAANASEAAVVEALPVFAVGSLAEAVGFLSGQLDIEPQGVDIDEVFRNDAHGEEDFSDVKGQDYAKRALVIAAAGSHNVLMIGPPGTGKTLLAKRLPSILPPLTANESLETTRIYSAMGLLRPNQALMATRPFRSPHHSVSDAGLVGGGSTPQPGEISLANHGVLFLDELPEFNRRTLEVLRQPLEEGNVTISRALRSVTFPADFVLVAAMNPCPCGYRSDPRRACGCSPPQVEKYLGRISGPLLDRIDLHVDVPAVPFTQLAEAPPGPTSADLRRQVLAARARQADRFGKAGPLVNGRMTPRQVRKYCPLQPDSLGLLKAAMEELGLSARAHDKVLRVARTMADLDDADHIQPHHIAEAVGFRNLDRGVWA
jgi:magnesium chelatase family protein